MTLHRVNGILFCSSQQFPRLCLGPLKGFLSWHSALQGPAPCALLPELQRIKDAVKRTALSAGVPDQRQDDANLDCAFVETALVFVVLKFREGMTSLGHPSTTPLNCECSDHTWDLLLGKNASGPPVHVWDPGHGSLDDDDILPFCQQARLSQAQAENQFQVSHCTLSLDKMQDSLLYQCLKRQNLDPLDVVKLILRGPYPGLEWRVWAILGAIFWFFCYRFLFYVTIISIFASLTKCRIRKIGNISLKNHEIAMGACFDVLYLTTECYENLFF